VHKVGRVYLLDDRVDIRAITDIQYGVAKVRVLFGWQRANRPENFMTLPQETSVKHLPDKTVGPC
jgi:hypothetical protein